MESDEELEFTEQCEHELDLFSRFISNGLGDMDQVQDSNLNKDLQKVLFELYEEGKKREEEGAAGSSTQTSAANNEFASSQVLNCSS